eukprot:scaffold240046_cov40-Prasinocladus_malaysianus.AAC.2
MIALLAEPTPKLFLSRESDLGSYNDFLSCTSCMSPAKQELPGEGGLQTPDPTQFPTSSIPQIGD